MALPMRPQGETCKQVMLLHSEGLTTTAIAQRLGVSAASVSYHKRQEQDKTGIKIIREQTTPDWCSVQENIDAGLTHQQICGKHRIAKQTLTVAYKKGIVSRPKLRREMSLAELAVAWDGKDASLIGIRKVVRLRLISAYGHRCTVCNFAEWNGGPIPLEVDHIDGCGLNNKPDNLRLICPNCHAQTPTYGGKNIGKWPKPIGATPGVP